MTPPPDARPAGVLDRASRIADDVLFPTAIATDRSTIVPRAHLDVLANAGLYGAAGPIEHHGLDLPYDQMTSLVELLAGGCLTTAFVWLQHHGLVRAVTTAADRHLRARWLTPLCRGDVRAGVVFAGLIPGPPRLRALPAADGWELDGTADWVTGWGRVDVLHVMARGPGDTLVSLIVDAADQAGLTVERRDLVAADASSTVTLTFARVAVAVERCISSVPFDPTAHAAGAVLRLNGSLALGVAGRACRLLGPGPLDDELAACRHRLDHAVDDEMADARAAASALAVRATATLIVETGSRAVRADDHAQRLAREALLLLVFGTRPAIKASLLRRLG